MKIKGMLTLTDFDRLGKEIGGSRCRLCGSRMPAAGMWRITGRRGAREGCEIGEVAEFGCFGSNYPVEKVMRVGLGPGDGGGDSAGEIPVAG